MALTALKRLCETYYTLEDHIALLREQIAVAEEEACDLRVEAYNGPMNSIHWLR
jgi:hypothetical protein